MNEHHGLTDFLSLVVPLRIMALQENETGGPEARAMALARGYIDDLGKRGDILLFGGGKKGEVAALANGLAQGIAILAFAPGGITIFGQHWEAKAAFPVDS